MNELIYTTTTSVRLKLGDKLTAVVYIEPDNKKNVVFSINSDEKTLMYVSEKDILIGIGKFRKGININIDKLTFIIHQKYDYVQIDTSTVYNLIFSIDEVTDFLTNIASALYIVETTREYEKFKPIIFN